MVSGPTPGNLAHHPTTQGEHVKAILITQANQNKVAVQYAMNLDDVEDLIPIGWVLLADFGSETFAGVLTQTRFDQLYTKGQVLENDYFIAVPK
jgi:hypothetical protein